MDFDKKTLTALLPKDKLYRVTDPKVSGLKLVVHPTGKKTWNVVKRIKGGNPLNRAIGEFPALSIQQARAMALDELSAIAMGINRNKEKRDKEAVSITLADARLRYLASKNVFEDSNGKIANRRDTEARFSKGSIKDYRTFIRVYMSDWAERELASITEQDIIKRYKHLCDDISAARANSAMRCFRAIYNYAYHTIRTEDRKAVLPENPVSVLGRANLWITVKRKKTIIRSNEQPSWSQALEPMRTEHSSHTTLIQQTYIYTLLYTGLRPSHILPLAASKAAYDRTNGAARGYFDSELGLFYFYTQKNDTEMEIPLSTQLLARIKTLPNSSRDWLIQTNDTALSSDTVKEAFRWISKRSGIKITPGDLRRTFLTIAESLDISPYTFKKLVGHKVEGLDVTGGYIHQERDRVRRATQTISDTIEMLSMPK